jgi:hypothetical protein
MAQSTSTPRSGITGTTWRCWAATIASICLSRLLNRADINTPWLFDRCREVERSPDGHLDLWARFHYKSTIITFAGVIQEVLVDPDLTVAIFSHTKPIAKAFLEQIKREFEENELLKEVYEDVLWAKPSTESQKWSADDGIIVKRSSNPRECTVEAHGLVDGQPISRHYNLLVYDDVVTEKSVTNAEQISKTTRSWELVGQPLDPQGCAQVARRNALSPRRHLRHHSSIARLCASGAIPQRTMAR